MDFINLTLSLKSTNYIKKKKNNVMTKWNIFIDPTGMLQTLTLTIAIKSTNRNPFHKELISQTQTFINSLNQRYYKP